MTIDAWEYSPGNSLPCEIRGFGWRPKVRSRRAGTDDDWQDIARGLVILSIRIHRAEHDHPEQMLPPELRRGETDLGFYPTETKEGTA